MKSSIKLRFFVAGHSLLPGEALYAGTGWNRVELPVHFVLIEHPLGKVLFDAGASPRIQREANRFPFFLYRSLAPLDCREDHQASALLGDIGTAATDIRLVILSHFHPDHIGGVRDFPEAVFLFWRKSYDNLKNRGLLGGFLRGFLKGLLPADFEPRSRYLDGAVWVRLEPEFAPFDSAWDVFEDRTVFAVPLPGHVEGHVGLLIRAEDATYFLVGDACFTSRSYRELVFPNLTAMRWLHDDPRKYIETVGKIHSLHKQRPDIKIIPSHCPEARRFWER